MYNTYLSMKNALCALELYDLDDSTVKAELISYACAFDDIRSELEKTLKEYFISTATGYGLEMRELVIGNKRNDLKTDTRRQMLMKRNSINSNSFTPDDIKSSLSSFNLDCEIHEIFDHQLVLIDAVGKYSSAEKQWIRSQVEKIIPAHLSFEIMFNSIPWSTLDAYNKTFAQLDASNKSWNDIDNAEI